MEHVNDDMDELFRKAGELYPLKTSASDWDGMAGKLRDEISGERGIPHAVPMRDNSTKRKWLLLLLVPAFIFSLLYFNRSRISEKNLQSVVKPTDPSGTKNNPVTGEISRPSGQTDNKAPTNTAPALNTVKNTAAHTPVTKDEINSDALAGKTSAQKLGSGKHVDSETIALGKTTQESALYQPASDRTDNLSDPESVHEPVQKPLFLSVYGLGESPSVYGTPFPPTNQKGITLNAETAGVAKNKTNKAASPKGIYAVLKGGPDWSTVKLQSTEQAGYSLGVLVGYRFNKRFSIETGLLWDKKNYYSDGGYFDKSKTSIPDTVNIKSLDGYCNMFEIPLNLKYNFAIRNNHNFFVEAGLSSYLMKKEHYDYQAEKTGWAGNWPIDSAYLGHKTYTNSTNDFFAVLQISGGYEYSIGKNTNILIEPYVKIPLGGIGIGNMPISSMGLYFGISHLFH